MLVELSWFCVRAIVKLVLFRILRSDLEREYFLALRENQILKRKQRRSIKIKHLDRLIFVAAAEKSKSLLARLVVVQPETVLGWYRNWVLRRIHRSPFPGRPPVSKEVVDLVIDMKRSNPRWGAGKIHGELQKVRIPLSERSIARILKRAGFCPAQRESKMNWLKFMRIHKEKIFACDFFTVPTLFLENLHVFFLMDLKNRAIVHWSVIKDPTGEWLGNQLRSVFSEVPELPEYLVTDRDRKFGSWLRPLLAGFEIKLFQIPPYRPWYNGYAERMVRTFREECVNLIVFGEKDLRRLVSEYVAYYNLRRPHAGIEHHAPWNRFELEPRPLRSRSEIAKREILGGLITDYERNAA